MSQKDPSQLSNQELVSEVKKAKSTKILDSFFVGFLVGIIIYSVVANSWGFLTIIPLFMIYAFLKKSKRVEEIKKELKNRNLD